MNNYKVFYESLSGKIKSVIVENVKTKEDAMEYVLCNYPDCFQITSVV